MIIGLSNGLTPNRRQIIASSNKDPYTRIYAPPSLNGLNKFGAIIFTPESNAITCFNTPDSKVHGANMGPTWVL